MLKIVTTLYAYNIYICALQIPLVFIKSSKEPVLYLTWLLKPTSYSSTYVEVILREKIATEVYK